MFFFLQTRYLIYLAIILILPATAIVLYLNRDTVCINSKVVDKIIIQENTKKYFLYNCQLRRPPSDWHLFFLTHLTSLQESLNTLDSGLNVLWSQHLYAPKTPKAVLILSTNNLASQNLISSKQPPAPLIFLDIDTIKEHPKVLISAYLDYLFKSYNASNPDFWMKDFFTLFFSDLILGHRTQESAVFESTYSYCSGNHVHENNALLCKNIQQLLPDSVALLLFQNQISHYSLIHFWMTIFYKESQQYKLQKKQIWLSDLFHYLLKNPNKDWGFKNLHFDYEHDYLLKLSGLFLQPFVPRFLSQESYWLAQSFLYRRLNTFDSWIDISRLNVLFMKSQNGKKRSAVLEDYKNIYYLQDGGTISKKYHPLAKVLDRIVFLDSSASLTSKEVLKYPNSERISFLRLKEPITEQQTLSFLIHLEKALKSTNTTLSILESSWMQKHFEIIQIHVPSYLKSSFSESKEDLFFLLAKTFPFKVENPSSANLTSRLFYPRSHIDAILAISLSL